MHGSQEVASSTKLLLLWKVSNDALQPPLSVRSVMRAHGELAILYHAHRHQQHSERYYER